MEDLKLQCFVCKKTISKDDNRLDPCSIVIYSNIDKDILDQKSQTFFCHFDCFRKIHSDDNTLYLDSISSTREFIEENKDISQKVVNLTDSIYRKAKEFGIWNKLFIYPSGKWILLRKVLDEKTEIFNELEKLEEDLYDKLIISWAEDYSERERSKNCLWKVVTVTTEGGYDYPIIMLVDLEKDFFEKLKYR
ncbi:UNVERIFIED_CONTAM: hypothetical protein Cloal_1878 [Acetivibrio alkalicellulosi]